MRLTVNLVDRKYDVIVEAGSIGHIKEYADLRRKVMVVSDDGVPAEYVHSVLSQAEKGFSVVVAKGEISKSLHGYETVLHALLNNKFTRHDCVVAVGGGVVGDLAGFAASTYMRGISFINCPTTTLSQIDSSIGGKVAINFDNTKNIVGAFYQPECVIADTATLKTLPRRHYINGLVEAVKAGLIADEKLFELFEKNDIERNLEEIILRSLNVKKNIVEQDEKESSLRAVLNFGHTIGHAVESLHMDEWYHGECVARGMIPMTEDKDTVIRLKAVLSRLGLDYRITDDPQRLFDIMTHDKKAGSDFITAVKVRKPGQVRLVRISYPQLRKIVEESVK